MGMIEYIGSIGGITGVLAFCIFLIYRQDKKSAEDRLREDRKLMEDRLTHVLDEYNVAFRENTKVLSELYTWLRHKNGHKD